MWFKITSRDSLSHLLPPLCCSHIFQFGSTSDSDNGPLDSCSRLLTGGELLGTRSCILHRGSRPTNRICQWGIRWETVFTPELQWRGLQRVCVVNTSQIGLLKPKILKPEYQRTLKRFHQDKGKETRTIKCTRLTFLSSTFTLTARTSNI